MKSLLRTAEAVIVRLPDEIDMANAESIYDQLHSACAPGVAVVADVTSTSFCDSSGVWQMAQAYREAIALGAELGFAVPSGGVRRVLELTGFDQLLPLYPTVDAALAAVNDNTVPHSAGSCQLDRPSSAPRALAAALTEC